jgi:hypothetical protein
MVISPWFSPYSPHMKIWLRHVTVRLELTKETIRSILLLIFPFTDLQTEFKNICIFDCLLCMLRKSDCINFDADRVYWRLFWLYKDEIWQTNSQCGTRDVLEIGMHTRIPYAETTWLSATRWVGLFVDSQVHLTSQIWTFYLAERAKLQKVKLSLCLVKYNTTKV